MDYSYRVVTACRLCGSTNLDIALSLEPMPLGDQYLPKGGGASDVKLVPFGINICPDCGNFQTVTAIDREHYRHCLTRPASTNLKLGSAYRESVPYLLELTDFSSSDLMLEIGSNDGLFASFFAERGFRCLGVEPALNLLKDAEACGVSIVPDFFTRSVAEKIVSEYGVAKIIVANSVVANVDDLDDFIIGINKVLAEDGICVMETNSVSDVVSSLLVETLVHEHLCYFSVTALAKYFEKHGLEMFNVKKVPAKGGSLRCFIKHKNSKLKVEQSVSDAIDLERSLEIFSPHAWAKFQNTFSDIRNLIKKFCVEKSQYGIVGYGTSDGATTLIYQLGFGEYLKALIDDDPVRQNLESPGFAIPTVDRTEIFTDQPKALNCLILAPQYVHQIFEKNKSAQESGVSFLQVWPRLEIMGSVL